MTREEANKQVEECVQIIDGFSLVSLEDTEKILRSNSSSEKDYKNTMNSLITDPIRSQSPEKDFFYKWNLSDYLVNPSLRHIQEITKEEDDKFYKLVFVQLERIDEIIETSKVKISEVVTEFQKDQFFNWSKEFENFVKKNGQELKDKKDYPYLQEPVWFYESSKLEYPEFLKENFGHLLNLDNSVGLTINHCIFLRKDQWNQNTLLHELRHVWQIESFKGWENFMNIYLSQLIDFGYEKSPLEIDARKFVNLIERKNNV